jgi:proprotein convertase subtilisin/kexin type 5
MQCEIQGNEFINCNRTYLTLAGKNICSLCEHGYYRYDDTSCYEVYEYNNYYEFAFYLFVDTYFARACDMACYLCIGNTFKECYKCPLIGTIYEYGVNYSTNPYSFQCLSSCPLTTYERIELSPYRAYCRNCHINCLKCFGDSNTECTLCTNITFSMTDISISHTCFKTCPFHYYLDRRTCQLCHDLCGGCTNNSNADCLTCDPGAYELENVLLTNICVEFCPVGYYVYGRKCLKCHQNCVECNGDSFTSCLKCSNISLPLEDITITFTCVSKCPYHYFYKSGFCRECDISCGNCYGYGNDRCANCSVIYKKYYVNFELTCVQKCESFCYYISEINECRSKCLY